ncbi:lipoprotein, tandem type [Leptospira fainei serovar Hurstbridge str. BUT 6]|uniref:Lipoprotein, tandem type n=1 Tax=Leptospira fainei serovar Hurstbridge str. BUT 6 TaxID=1193011 RepID=S3UVF2_9LEPT|nr:lipoprotein, tandem type [Leptospira fainei]EPG74376.1 lipoprotein, tandem type [Leptospira fainei serovar Hurstbridge str. BUT 6]
MKNLRTKILFFLIIQVCFSCHDKVAEQRDRVERKLRSVYELGGSMATFLGVKGEVGNAFYCFDFRPDEQRAFVKFIGFPPTYELQAVKIDAINYKLIYQNGESTLKFDINESGKPEDVNYMLEARVYQNFKGLQGSSILGDIDLVLGPGMRSVRFGRQDTFEECEERHFELQKLSNQADEDEKKYILEKEQLDKERAEKGLK